ncbi:MAG TPA: threonine--tRNA ligase [Gammaproteobacteria bacterium]|nr:threonine--tRNA ligase [Gammaproteobacteria bacterium]
MPVIILPDGQKKEFLEPVSVADVAAAIGAGLAKAALAGKVNGKLVDTSYMIDQDAHVAIITERDPEGLEIIRHSTAHLLAHAVKQLFPQAQVTIGPVIEDGFYYDFSWPQGFTPADLDKIQERMQELAKQDFKVMRREISREEAIAFFRAAGEEYKAQIIESIPVGETLTLYQQGDFTDLCRGPHVPRTGLLKVFKLTKVAGAYWRGNSNNEMLQRIYGTAWADKKALADYLQRLEEAEKRDHRKLAKKLDLFHFQEEAPGMVFWHADGWTIYQTIEQYLRRKLRAQNYLEVRTPQLLDRSLWEKSGHWEKFGDDMFYSESESRQYAVKPMSCPCHVQIFKHGFHSYRDLPLRFAEFGSCHRNEPSGSLHGLMRVRSFVQDDGHIFCTEAQVADEAAHFITQLRQIYADFGFNDIIVRLSTRPEKRMGSDAIWDKAEHALENVLNASGLAWEFQPGEGAFYGPKVEFSLRDCLQRVWQCGTLQVDFLMPERLGAHYIAEDSSKQTPVMLHRAIIGTFERFMGILLEEYAGHLPLWLMPVQVVVMNITDQQRLYADQIVETLKNHGLKVIADLRNEKIGFKIREHTLKHVPYQLIIGDRELETNTVSVRTKAGQDLGSMTLNDFIHKLQVEIAQHSKSQVNNPSPTGEGKRLRL